MRRRDTRPFAAAFRVSNTGQTHGCRSGKSAPPAPRPFWLTPPGVETPVNLACHTGRLGKPVLMDQPSLRLLIPETLASGRLPLERLLHVWGGLGAGLLVAPRSRAARRGGHLPRSRGTPAGPSLNHLIRPLEERRRDREPERLRLLQVDHELDLRGLLDREIGRSCSL